MIRLFVPAAALLATACATTAGGEPGETHLAYEGRQLAEEYCASCHAIGKTGESPHPDAPTFERAANRYPPAMLAEAFAEGIQVGHPDMPVFEMTPDNIDRLIAYLETLRAES